MRSGWLVLFVLWAGCIRSDSIPCGDLECPASTVCLAERGVCASHDALAVCDGIPDGTPCVAPQIDGACDAGLCVASVCGDLDTTGREQCDGSAELSCLDFRFYEGSLACTQGCLYDTSGCSGRCGDGVVQTAAGEVCDGSVPERGCSELGYDYGHLSCTALCSDSSLLDCDRFEPRIVFAPELGSIASVLDAWRVGKVVVVSRGTDGLVVLDQGVRYDISGEFGRIAGRGTTIAVASGMGVARVVQHALVPEPSLGTLTKVAGLAFAPSGNLWAVTESCEVRELVGGSWQVRPAPVGNRCEWLEIDAAGDVYTIVRPVDVREVGVLHAGVWTKVPGTDGARGLGVGRAGTVNATIDGADSGIYELSGTTATLYGEKGPWFEAAPIGNGYMVTTIEPARILEGRPVLFFRVAQYPFHIRKLPDGSVLMWGETVTEVTPLMHGHTGNGEFRAVRHDSKLGFVHFAQNSIGSYPGQTYPRTEFLTDLAVANGVVYVASASGLLAGVPAAMQLDTSVMPQRVWAGANGDVAVVDYNFTIKVRRAGTQAWIALPQGCGNAYGVAGTSVDDLYTTRACTTNMMTIERWNGTAWTTVYTTPASLGAASIALPDGTIAFAGSAVVFGSGTTWQELPAEAFAIGGVSKDDLWLAGARRSGADPYGLLHWDGKTLAGVRWTDPENPLGIAADADTVFAVSGNQFHAIARWNVP